MKTLLCLALISISTSVGCGNGNGNISTNAGVFDIDDSVSAGADAGAGGTLSVRCGTSSNRSTASVDAEGLDSGNYFAVISSGGNEVESNLEITVNNEVEFDFDSDDNDIDDGATAIDENFVQGTLTGALYTQEGLLVHSGTINCDTN